MSQEGWKPPKDSRSAKGVALLLSFPGCLITIPAILLFIAAVIVSLIDLGTQTRAPNPAVFGPTLVMIGTITPGPTPSLDSNTTPVTSPEPFSTIEAVVGEPTRVLIINPNSTPTPQGGAIVEKLTFRVFLEGCRMAPTADKPGNRKVGLNVDPTGGTPPFRYQLEGQAPQDSDVLNRDWEQGTRLVGRITVWSSDGQQVTSDFDMDVTRIQCEPTTP